MSKGNSKIGESLSRNPFIIPTTLLVIVAGLYISSLKSPFMVDDYSTIVDNYFIRTISNIRYLFTKKYFVYFGELTYRPLATLTYFLDYRIYGLNSVGFHLTNLFFHLLSVLLSYLVIITITKNLSIAFFSSLVFGIHPLQAEVVNGISFREDSMAVAFSLLSFFLILKGDRQDINRYKLFYFFSLLAFTFAVFSKESALIFPLIMILYEFIFPLPKRTNCTKKTLHRKLWTIGLLIICLLYLVLSQVVLISTTFYQKPTYLQNSFMITMMTMGKVFLYYLSNVILPVHLYIDYVIPPVHSLWTKEVILSVLIITALLLIGLKTLKEHKPFSFGIFFFFIALLPVSNIVPISHIISDRYLYMPLWGACLIFGYVLTILTKKTSYRIALFSPIFLFFSFFLVKQNILWQSEEHLWKHVLTKFPNSFNTYSVLGDLYARKGDWRMSLNYFNKALKIKPDLVEGYLGRGVAYAGQGKTEQSLANFNHASLLNPYYYKIFYNRGLTLAKMGKLDKALSDFNKTIELNPSHAKAYNNRGNLFYISGNWKNAIKDYSKAISIQPAYALAFYNRAFTYLKTGQTPAAIYDLKEAIRLGYLPARKVLQQLNHY